jgi:hypothetical protein
LKEPKTKKQNKFMKKDFFTPHTTKEVNAFSEPLIAPQLENKKENSAPVKSF